MSIVGWAAMAVGVVVLLGSVVGALGPVIPPAEARVFRAVNGLPDWLFRPLWVPMQLGNLVVGAGVGLVVAVVLREWRVAVAVVAAVALKLVAERVLRHRMARHLAVRQRPGTSEPGAVRRGGDVPASGPSFPSGHVILVAAITCVVADVLPTRLGGGAVRCASVGHGRPCLRGGPQPVGRHRRARCRPAGGRRPGRGARMRDRRDHEPTGVIERSPADVLRLVVAAVIFVLTAIVSHFVGGTTSRFVADVLAGFSELPTRPLEVLITLGELLGVGLIVIGGVVVVLRRQWRLLGGVASGVALSLVLFWLTRPGADSSAALVTDIADWVATVRFHTPSSFTLAAVAAVTAAVTPWISRRWRRAWWAALIAVALAHFLGTPVSLETVLAVLSGWVAGSASVVLLGAPSRRPSEEAVVDGLRSVGADLERLEPASVDARGSTPYFGALRDGTAVFVKTLGDDERSADLLFRLYRSIQPRDLHDERPFSSLRRTVEHEALVAVMAANVGVRTPPLVAFAPAVPNGYTLAYVAVAGHSLDGEPDGDGFDQLIREVWGQVAILRRRGIAHRDLRLANVFVGEDRVVWIIDFGFSELAADEVLLDGDVAELLASTASVMGPERAVAAAADVMGAEAVRRCGHRLRPALLSGATRSSLAHQPGVLDRLVALASRGLNAPPHPNKVVRRVMNDAKIASVDEPGSRPASYPSRLHGARKVG